MRELSKLLIVSVLIMLSISCSKEEDLLKPEFIIDMESLSFGKIKLNEEKKLDFTVSNNGAVDLEIKSITLKGDAKDAFSIETSAEKVESKKEVSLTIKFVPKTAGDKQASLEIVTNAGTKTLSLSGTGEEDTNNSFSFDKSSLDFGEVEISQKKSMLFTIKNNESKPLAIQSFTLKGTNKAEFLSYGRAQNIEAGKSQAIRIDFKPSSTGDKQASLAVVTDAGTKTLSLSGKGKEKSESAVFTSVSGDLNFGDVGMGETKTLDYTIKNTGNKGLSISSIKIDDYRNKPTQLFNLVSDQITSLAAGETKVLKIKFAPTFKGNAQGEIIFNTALGVKKFTLKGRGLEAPAPKFRLITTSLDMGGQLVNPVPALDKVNQESVELQNIGTKTLEISSITISGPDANQFKAIDGDGNTVTKLSVPVRNQKGILIRFTPTSMGEKTATLTMVSNDGTKSVPLKGKGQNILLAIAFEGKTIKHGDSFDYGKVVRGNKSKVYKKLTVTNNGNLPMNFKMNLQDHSPSQFFEILYTTYIKPITIEPGEKKEFTIFLLGKIGTTRGAVSCNLKIVTNARNSGTRFGYEKIKLTGQVQ